MVLHDRPIIRRDIFSSRLPTSHASVKCRPCCPLCLAACISCWQVCQLCVVLPVVVVSQHAIQHRPSIFKQVHHGLEERDPHNGKEAQLGARHPPLLCSVHQGTHSQAGYPLLVTLKPLNTWPLQMALPACILLCLCQIGCFACGRWGDICTAMIKDAAGAGHGMAG